MDFLNWNLSQYIIQTVIHSLIIAFVVEAMISLWHIRKPLLQIKFRFLVLLLPVVYLPVYILLFPLRSGTYFYEHMALLDFNGWLRLRLLGEVTVGHFFIALLILTTVFFLVREAIPTIRYFLRRHPSLPTVPPGQFPKLDQVLARLARDNYFQIPKVLLSAEAVPSVYKFVHKALVISASTIDMLDSEELEAVITHELAHLTGQGYRILQMSLILRALMFYNPVALFVLRRILNDNEKDCDDIAIRATGKRLALASGLLRVFRQTAASIKRSDTGWSRFTPRISTLENQFYWGLIEERVKRLAHHEKVDELYYVNFRISIMTVLLLALLFFVV